jgi:hypothetical protein
MPAPASSRGSGISLDRPEDYLVSGFQQTDESAAWSRLRRREIKLPGYINRPLASKLMELNYAL